MPVKMLKEYLDKQHVNYVCLSHSPAFTAQEVAASAHVSGKLLAKIVMVKIDEKLAMIVLPAHDHVDFAALKTITGKSKVDLASEASFKGQFPGCEVGAMPPFGNLYNMPVFVSNKLQNLDQLIFNAGTHSELMKVMYEDFERLVNPKVIETA